MRAWNENAPAPDVLIGEATLSLESFRGKAKVGVAQSFLLQLGRPGKGEQGMLSFDAVLEEVGRWSACRSQPASRVGQVREQISGREAAMRTQLGLLKNATAFALYVDDAA